MEIAILGAGCFWCIEALFSRLSGVNKVISGYCNGKTVNPTYESVCTGTTGHAEVCKIIYNPMIIPYTELLDIFFKIHNPTTLNRQGNDIGTQYRSSIFYLNNNQKMLAEKSINKLDKEKIFSKPILTEIKKLDKFYIAEDYHQNYYNNNLTNPYCKLIIKPKLKKI